MAPVCEFKMVFDYDNEQERFMQFINAPTAHDALRRIADEVFRPHRKHGYNCPKIRKAIDEKNVDEVIGLLEEMFWQIIRDNELKI